MLLIFLEGLVSYPSFDALPPDSPGGWISLAAGVLLVAIGAWAAYRGIDGLGPSLTAAPRPAEDGRFVADGIYARVRHPIYAGVIGVAIGWAFVVVSPIALLVAVALAGWLDLKSRREEAWLVERYPAYAEYRRGRARFFPGIY